MVARCRTKVLSLIDLTEALDFSETGRRLVGGIAPVIARSSPWARACLLISGSCMHYLELGLETLPGEVPPRQRDAPASRTTLLGRLPLMSGLIR